MHDIRNHTSVAHFVGQITYNLCSGNGCMTTRKHMIGESRPPEICQRVFALVVLKLSCLSIRSLLVCQHNLTFQSTVLSPWNAQPESISIN